MKKRKPSSSNPSKSHEEEKLFRALRAAVELVRDMKGKVSDERYEMLRASAAGLMFVYAEMKDLPDPIDVLIDNMLDEERQKYYDLAG